ncbi:MAG: anaerobic glycerol-3-phosphate dehydrogenase subunit B [Deltaproteobacteria bacterium]|nr:anaerobic glycerol-3-phosphate dehydrogenase subunit B [Deltaproteobacteria bacterium]
MAGAIAALAAREAGASVLLARRGPGGTALSGGAVGVAPDAGAPSTVPFALRLRPMEAARRLAALRPAHPYAIAGVGRLAEALDFAARALPGLLAPFEDRSRFLVTAGGGVAECGLCQRSQVAGDLALARGLVAAVGFRGHLGFDARPWAAAVAGMAAAGAPPSAWAEAELFGGPEEGTLAPHELARALERPGAAEAAGAAVRAVLPAGAAVALLPPVLGLDPAVRVLERLAAAAGVPVAETLADVPSVPGLRLQAALEARLAAAGVELVSGKVELGGWPRRPLLVAGQEREARAVVLASGRFVGGGLVRHGELREALLGLPVEATVGGESGTRLAGRPAPSLTRPERRAPQPLLAAGLRVDAAMRPLGESGQPAHPRLFAAGAVIGGYENAADGTGLGAAILTGYLAGKAAAG